MKLDRRLLHDAILMGLDQGKPTPATAMQKRMEYDAGDVDLIEIRPDYESPERNLMRAVLVRLLMDAIATKGEHWRRWRENALDCIKSTFDDHLYSFEHMAREFGIVPDAVREVYLGEACTTTPTVTRRMAASRHLSPRLRVSAGRSRTQPAYRRAS